jgi:outer membrane protein OmpA-like peptidoglycan-associated protein
MQPGNVGISTTTWRILGKPVVSLDASSDSGISSSDRITRDSTPQINVAGLSGGGGTVTVTATKSGSTPLTCTFVATSTSGHCDLPDAVDGTWSITAVESVRVGASTVNSATSDPIAVTIDTVTPTKPTASFSVNGIAVTPGSVIQLGAGVTSGALTFTSQPSSEVGAALLCSLNGATAVPCPAGGFASVPNGMNTLTVTAVDLAGNESSTALQWFQVPQITLGLDPSSSLKTDSSGNVLSSSRTQSVSASGFVAGELVTVTASSDGKAVTCTYTPNASGEGACSLTFTADGLWSISASQTITPMDEDGNDLSPVTTTKSLDPLTVDTTAPVLTSQLRIRANALVVGTTGSATAFKTSETTLGLSATATDLTATTITCALNGAAAGACPAELTDLAYGVHTLVVEATDAVGNVSTDTLTWHVTAPPTVALVASSDTGKSDSDGVTNDTTPTITVGNLGEDVDVVVTATKGAETVMCYLWHANEAGPAPGSADCTFGTLIDGSWTITATQTISGRPEWISPASASTTVVVDSIAPSTPTATFTHGITPGALTTQTTIDFASGPTSTDVSTIDYTCSLNGAAPAPCAASTDLSAGSHRLVYTATDLAGNASSGTLSWTIIGPPTVALKASSDTGVSNSDRITNDTSPVIEVNNLIPGANVTVTATKGSETVTCTFVAGAPATPTGASSTGECQLPGLTSDGNWVVTAVQSIGGTPSTASAPMTVTLDTLPPRIGTPTTVTVEGETVSVFANPDITAVAADIAVPTGGGTESSAITLTLPGKEASAIRECSLNGMAHDCAVTALTGMATGVHTFTITDTDLAGNTTTQSFVWSVVGVPTVALVPSSDSGPADFITNIETPEFTAGALIDGATVQITATRGALTRTCSFIAVDGVTSCELPPLSDGVWSVTSRQGFGSGWSTPSSAVNITIDATAPADFAVTFTSGGKQLIFHGEVVDEEGDITPADETAAASSTVALSALTSNDAHAVTYTCSLNGAAAVPCPAEFSGLPSGVNTLVLTATDIAGNSSTLIRNWSVIAAPVVTLAAASDTGVVGDGITAEQLPFFDVSNVMPGATVTVTATKSGSAPVTCTFTAPSVAPPARSSAGSCQAGASISGAGWSVTAAQTYTTTTSDLADRVTLTSAASAPFALDVVQPHEVVINAPTEVSIAEGSLSLESLDPRSLPMSFLEVTLTSLTPSVCTINADGDVVLLRPGTCTLRGTAPGGDDGAGTFFDTGIRTVSFAVLPVNTVSTLPSGAVAFGGAPISLPLAPVGSNRPATPSNAGSGSQDGAGPTRGIKRPPPPVSLVTEPLPGNRRANVTVTVNQDRPGAPVRGVVLLVLDQSGAQRHRVAINVQPGATVVTARVPFNQNDQVRAFTTNDAGVSNRAPVGANVLSASTIQGKRPDGTPVLFGTRVAKPILFDPNSPALTAQSRRALDGVVKYSKKNGGRVFITGFVRNQGGDPRFQKRLSADRAQQVAQYLSARGVRTWIRYNGYGAFRNGQGLPQDRRVEVRWSADEIPNLKRTRANAPFAGLGMSQGGTGL